jgi:hypothetical protein
MNQDARKRMTDELITRLFRLALPAGVTEAGLRYECGLMSDDVLQLMANASDEELRDMATGVLPEKCTREDLKRRADRVDGILKGREDDRLRLILWLLKPFS